MLTKRSYFQVTCDHSEPGDRCRTDLRIYTPEVSEGAASEWALRQLRRRGWRIYSQGRKMAATTLCPRHAAKGAGVKAAETALTAALTDDPDDALVAALAADGYPPLAGTVWRTRDTQPWFPDGQYTLTTVTSVGKTLAGWQARVDAITVDRNGKRVGAVRRGLIFVDQLLRNYKPVTKEAS